MFLFGKLYFRLLINLWWIYLILVVSTLLWSQRSLYWEIHICCSAKYIYAIMAVMALSESTVIWLMLPVCLAPTHHLPYICTLFNYTCTCLFGESMCGSSIGCQSQIQKVCPRAYFLRCSGLPQGRDFWESR